MLQSLNTGDNKDMYFSVAVYIYRALQEGRYNSIYSGDKVNGGGRLTVGYVTIT